MESTSALGREGLQLLALVGHLAIGLPIEATIRQEASWVEGVGLKLFAEQVAGTLRTRIHMLPHICVPRLRAFSLDLWWANSAQVALGACSLAIATSWISLCGLTARLRTVFFLVSERIEVRVRNPFVGVNVNLRVRPLSDGLLRAEHHGALQARVCNIVDRTLREQGLLKLDQLLCILWMLRRHWVNLILNTQWHFSNLNRGATVYASFLLNDRRETLFRILRS